MKKHTRIPLLFLVVFLFLVLTPASVSASENKSQAKETSGFLQLYKTENNLASGLKLRLWRNLHTGANIEYYASNRDTKLHLTGIYLLPHEFIFFRFYGGAGYQFSRKKDGEFPYLVLGSHYVFLFSEVLYPWKDEAAPLVRFGFSFDF
ncbi:MAG TPA: hypothetical protein GXZ98_08225 [Firmicutes bacterium]|nr:hypothetical protein [Bacillota bacterium]